MWVCVSPSIAEQMLWLGDFDCAYCATCVALPLQHYRATLFGTGAVWWRQLVQALRSTQYCT